MANSYAWRGPILQTRTQASNLPERIDQITPRFRSCQRARRSRTASDAEFAAPDFQLPRKTLVRFPRATRLPDRATASLAPRAPAFSAMADAEERRPAAQHDIAGEPCGGVGAQSRCGRSELPRFDTEPHNLFGEKSLRNIIICH